MARASEDVLGSSLLFRLGSMDDLVEALAVKFIHVVILWRPPFAGSSVCATVKTNIEVHPSESRWAGMVRQDTH